MPIRSASLAAAAQLVLVAGAAAQYSSNSAANLFIADLPNDQVQPKVVAHPDGGCYVFGTDTRSATTHVVFGGKVSGAGTLDWSNIPSSTVVTKSRLWVALSSCGYAILAWHNGAVGSADIQAQNVNADGSLGLCYANCDCSMVAPILNVNDFVCFINRFGEESPYANCDASTIPPVLNVNDFLCFMNAFSAGCT
ncbi:MAG: hypothetical protein JNM80_05795 [Phycisphaerae bacterium]|nr:hypothetical protein [Phycisphaerae bacterium]